MEGRLGRTQVWRLKTWARDPHRHEANCVAMLGALEVGRSCALRGAGQRGPCVEPGGPALRPGRWVPPSPGGGRGAHPTYRVPGGPAEGQLEGPSPEPGRGGRAVGASRGFSGTFSALLSAAPAHPEGQPPLEGPWDPLPTFPVPRRL